MKIEEMLQQRDDLVKQAKAILGAEDISQEDFDEAKSLKDKADKLNQRIAALRELDEAGTQHDGYEPVRPPLPGTNPSAGSGQAGKNNGTLPPQPQNNGEGQNGDTPPQSKGDAVKSFYVTKYGEPNTAIKAILGDIYGGEENWENARWAQLTKFNRYLRDPHWVPQGEDERVLRHTILSGPDIEQAIMKGATVEMLKATMVEADDTLGGYAVPPDQRNTVISRIAATARIRPLAMVDTTSSDQVTKLKSTGGDDQYPGNVRITWVDETPTSTVAETNLTYGQERIPVYTAMATVPISRNMVEDAAYDLIGHLTRDMGDAFAINEDNQFINGDGAGKPMGILVGGANTNGLTEIETGNASALQWFSDTTGEGILGMIFAIAQQYLDRAGVRWLMNRSTAEQIARLQDGESRAYWMDADRNAMRLLNYQVLLHEGMPDVAASAFPILFGDLASYNIVDRVGMTLERYLDSTTASTNTVKYVARRRVGGKLVAPWGMAAQVVST